MRLISILYLTFFVTAVSAQEPNERVARAQDTHSIHILLVVAHPDDEYEMAATVYRITTELHGVADEIIVTDGEAGYHYSSLAERYYGVALTDGVADKARLAHIRVEESRRAAKVLGVRRQWFLGEKNVPFTQSANSTLHSNWRTTQVLQTISDRIKEEQYDFVFVLLPDLKAHGEHKAASILTLKAVKSLSGEKTPIVLGAAAGNNPAPRYDAVSGESLTQTLTSEPQFHFDRDTHFGYQKSLSYQIVVDWVIAEHKSQGLFQTKCLQDRYENFWIFSTEVPQAVEKAAVLFNAVSRVQTLEKEN
jgi:N-acetylglucosamine malate deacetylase 2